MGVVLSASAVQNVGGSSGAHTFSHTFSGKGAVVLIGRGDNHNNEVSAVSVGGVALTRQVHNALFTPSRHAEIWAVASGIGSGSLTVSITQPNSSDSFAVAIDWTNDSGGTISIGTSDSGAGASGTWNTSLDSGTKNALGVSCIVITGPVGDLSPVTDNSNINTQGSTGSRSYQFCKEDTNTVGSRSLGWSTGNNPKAGCSLLLLDDGPQPIEPDTVELEVEVPAGLAVIIGGDANYAPPPTILEVVVPEGLGITTTYPLQVALVGEDREIHRHTSGGTEGQVLTYHEESEPDWQDGGTPGSINLDDLDDVNAPSPTDGQVLTWDDGAGEWIAADATGGGGGGDMQTQSATDSTSGTLGTSSTSFVNVNTALDLTFTDCVVGTKIVLWLNALSANENHGLYVDAVTLVSGSPVNSVGKYDNSGVPSTRGVPGWWPSAGLNLMMGAPIRYTVQSGDLAAGSVTFRLRFASSDGSTRSIIASTDYPLRFQGMKVTDNGGGGGASAAEDVSYDNATSGLSATDVQAAIDEIVAEGSIPPAVKVYLWQSFR